MKDEKLDNFYNLELLKDMHSITEIFLRYELRLHQCWTRSVLVTTFKYNNI